MGVALTEDATRALDATTWDAFARLAEKHKGGGFGCWCTWFHSRVGRPEGEKGRPWKERLVREGDAHAALVFDGDAAVARAIVAKPCKGCGPSPDSAGPTVAAALSDVFTAEQRRISGIA